MRFSWRLDTIQPSWADLSVMLRWFYWSWKLSKSLGMTTKDCICKRELGTHSINDFAGTMSWCWRFKRRMACVQVHKLNTTKVICQFWKQRNCISNLDREIIWMKFPYISVSASKAVKIRGAQIITGKASGHKKICYTV